MPATEPIRCNNKLRELAEYWLNKGNIRNYALVVVDTCTALRISDLLRLQWPDVYDFATALWRTHITVREGKTKKVRVIALNKKALHALRLLFKHRRGDYIFASNRKNAAPISRIQAWRIVKEAVIAVKIPGCISVHSLRKVMGYFAWQAGVSLVLIMELYDHSRFEVTRRYLGIAQADRDRVILELDLF